MSISLLIVESHPIQYRAPVYLRLHQLCPGAIHVVYASDFSLRGGYDQGFASAVTWDSDLLSGYPSTILSSHLADAPAGWNDLNGRGLQSLIKQLCPRAILLTSLNYRYDHLAYCLARWRGIPLWMRCETQDYSFQRSAFKSLLRFMYYRLLYGGITKAFPIGKLNRKHWLRHGLHPSQLTDAHYCTPDRCSALSIAQRYDLRHDLRRRLGIQPHHYFVAFFGKLIPKKDPALLLDALAHLPKDLCRRTVLAFVGSGALQPSLEARAFAIHQKCGVPIHFPGFVNQSRLVDWYLAADVVVLPSRQAGETWGLVANEALQAGCSVVVSEAVGCSADFVGWERFLTIPVGSSSHLASALSELSRFHRSFTWASLGLQSYSTEFAAQALAKAVREIR